MNHSSGIALHGTLGVIVAWVALLFFSTLAFGHTVPGSHAKMPADWVNPYVGTAGGGNDYGGTMPLVTTPFGMTNWTAQTRQNRISVTSYAWEDSEISGFIGTHQPAIWMGDFGYVTVVPELDGLKTTPEARALKFKHSDEAVTPYYYSVLMDAGQSRGVKAEVTASDHCGFLRFAFRGSVRPAILVEATRRGITDYVAVDRERHEVVGYNPDRMDAHLGPLALPNFKGYFVVHFDQPFSSTATYEGS